MWSFVNNIINPGQSDDRNPEAFRPAGSPFSSSANSSPAQPHPEDNQTPYHPASRHEVYHTAFLLRQRLVPDLVPRILNEAEYWTVRTQRTDTAPRIADAARGEVILATEPAITADESRRVQRVVFTVRSRDQGWGGDPADRETERGSWTWFEAHVKKRDQLWHRLEIEKADPRGWHDHATMIRERARLRRQREERAPDQAGTSTDTNERLLINSNGDPDWEMINEDDLDPRTRTAPPCAPGTAAFIGPRLMTNLTAGQAYRTQQVEWRSNDDSIGPDGEEVGAKVKGIKKGDRVALTAHAFFPGWVNVVSWAEMKVYVAHVR